MLVTAITGGNPVLDADRRNVLKLGANWQPFEKTDLHLRGEYVHQTIARPISNIMVTSAIEAAFPDRFVRDDTGQLTAVDLRPANFQSSERNTLRIGFDFSKPLKSRQPSQAVMDKMRAQFGGRARGQNAGGSQQDNSSPPSNPPGGALHLPAVPRLVPHQRMPRLQAAAATFAAADGSEAAAVAASLAAAIAAADLLAHGYDHVCRQSGDRSWANLDYLRGDASGQSGGTPRHQVEAQAGFQQRSRRAARWQPAQRHEVNTLTGDNLNSRRLRRSI